MMGEVTGSLMVVTGAARGIGRAITERALNQGSRVAAVDIDGDELAVLAADLSTDRLHTAVVDTTDSDGVDAWLAGIQRDLGAPDALVNNVGTLRRGRIEELDVAEWRRVIDINLTGTLIMTQRVGRAMIGQGGGGSIVSIASTASEAWTVGAGAYSCSKAGVAMLMRGAAIEWGVHGIRANAVSPGFTATRMTAPTFANPETAAPRLARIPLGRIAEPGNIAGVVMFLCSPAAVYVTGQNIAVDGGLLQTTLMAPVPQWKPVT